METSITTTVGDNPPPLETERCFQLYIAINFLSPQLQGRLTNRWKATELRLTLGDINALQHAVVIAKKQARTCAVREIQEKRDQSVAGLHTLVWGGGGGGVIGVKKKERREKKTVAKGKEKRISLIFRRDSSLQKEIDGCLHLVRKSSHAVDVAVHA